MEPLISRKPRHWWVFLFTGIAFIVLGIYLIWSPTNGFATLGFLFGLVILVTGIFELLRVVGDRDQESRARHLILGVVDIIIGIILLWHIGTSETLLRIIVGIYFVFRGFSLISFSHLTGRNWMLTLGGALIVLFGLMIIFNAVFGAVTIVIFTALAFIVTGIFNVLLGAKLK